MVCGVSLGWSQKGAGLRVKKKKKTGAEYCGILLCCQFVKENPQMQTEQCYACNALHEGMRRPLPWRAQVTPPHTHTHKCMAR